MCLYLSWSQCGTSMCTVSSIRTHALPLAATMWLLPLQFCEYMHSLMHTLWNYLLLIVHSHLHKRLWLYIGSVLLVLLLLSYLEKRHFCLLLFPFWPCNFIGVFDHFIDHVCLIHRQLVTISDFTSHRRGEISLCLMYIVHFLVICSNHPFFQIKHVKYSLE